MKPWLPYCPGNDFSIRPKKAEKMWLKPATVGTTKYVAAAAEEDSIPSVIVVGGINWRFADPQAEALASISFSKLEATPLALTLMAGLGAKQGLSADDTRKVFDAFSNVDQIALSIRGDRVLMMASGYPRDASFTLEPGWKSAAVQNAVLIGLAEDVDQAMQRIAADGPLTELAGLARHNQANGNFWAAGALNGEMKRFSLTASMRDRLNSDIAFEFTHPPDANTTLPAFGTSSIQGNTVHVKMSLEGEDVEQSLTELATTPLGRYLGILVKSGRYLPTGDGKSRPKPVIRGLNEEPK